MFFSYVCNSKKIGELFTPTLNGMAVAVRCVSFTIVILNTRPKDYLRRMQTKETIRNKKSRGQ